MLRWPSLRERLKPIDCQSERVQIPPCHEHMLYIALQATTVFYKAAILVAAQLLHTLEH